MIPILLQNPNPIPNLESSTISTSIDGRVLAGMRSSAADNFVVMVLEDSSLVLEI